MIYTLISSPLGELTVVRDDTGIAALHLPTGKNVARREASWARDDDAFDDVRLQRRHSSGLRTAAEPRRHEVLTASLGGPAGDHLRRDSELRSDRGGDRSPERLACGGCRERPQSDRDRHPLPSSHRQRWFADRLWRRDGREALAART